MSTADQPPLCAFCGRRPVEPAWRPFCSTRCKLQDLARWATGGYRIAGEPTDPAHQPGNPDATSPHTDRTR